MKNKKSVCYYVLLGALTVGLHPADAVIRVGNPARNNAVGYQKLNEIKNTAANINTPEPRAATYQTTSNPQETTTPTPVKTVPEACSNIYPDGEFVWSVPTVGPGIGGAETCAAVVEIRALNAAEDGSDLVVARAHLPAGSAVKCNISEFPEATWLPAAGTIEFPADKEPTVDDVIDVMDEEQKDDLGIKIAAATIIGGGIGNIIGENEPGKDGLFGTGKEKTKTTIVGALGGAALMLGHTQTGKVAGDMILSAGVNATAGAVVGNIVSTGGGVLRFETCKYATNDNTTKCLWGSLIEPGAKIEGGKKAFYHTGLNRYYVCDIDANNADKYKNCTQTDLTNVKVDTSSASIEELRKKDFAEITTRYKLDENNSTVERGEDGTAPLIILSSANLITKRRPAALIVNDSDEKMFGSKNTDWSDIKKGKTDDMVWLRNTKNELYKDGSGYQLTHFQPLTESAENGALIDFHNKARLKSTATGAAVGGSLGAFSAYQGAQKDIDERWLAEVRAYKDSLGKVVCATGKYFLGYYNDMIIIPNMPEGEQK